MGPVALGEALARALAASPDVRDYLVACSAGVDSSSLLHALACLPGLEGRLGALHVDHGLHPDSGRWAEACARLCERLGVPLRIERLRERPRPGQSIEAWAREARYARLAAALRPGQAVLTAHHRDDQAETLLLALLRGAGPHGLGAMPARQPLGEGWLLRPLLELPGAALRAYAAHHGLEGVEDPSNADPRFDRNFLRHHVLPGLAARWPSVGATLARAARLQREASQWLDSVCDAWLEAALEPGGALPAAALLARPTAERAGLLRRWLRRLGLPLPQARHLRELCALAEAGEAAGGRVGWPGAEVRRYRGRLHAMAALPPAPPAGHRLPWGESPVLVTPCGRLERLQTTGFGVSRARADGARWEVGFRAGGERCRPPGRAGHSAPLKKILQEQGVAPWERERLPLLYLDGELAAVGDRFVCLPFTAGPGEPGWRLDWVAAPA